MTWIIVGTVTPQVTGSKWLENFASVSEVRPQSESLTFGSALRQGSWATFLHGEYFYVSTLRA